LESLLDAIFNRLHFPGPSEIIVVDNDASRSADDVVRKFSNRSPGLKIFRVPIQNISLARNKAVAETHGKWIAMIDDDEIPGKDWLVNLHRCAVDLEADAVFGPVLPRFPTSAPAWIVEGGFFDRPRLATGSVVSPSDTRTGNVLIRASIINQLKEPFDPDLGLTGGEDSMLFLKLLNEGKRLFWCDEAPVEEWVAEDRLNGRWLIKRWFRGGQSFAQSVLNPVDLGHPSASTKLLFFCRSILLAAGAIVPLVVSLPFGRTAIFRWIKVLAIQAGKLCPPTLFRYQEYRDKSRKDEKEELISRE
jgi:succinoglycan biosynthesis protein ExoM